MSVVAAGYEQHEAEELTGLAERITGFLDRHADRRPEAGARAHLGSGMFELHAASGDLADVFEACRTFQSALFDAHLAGLRIPSRYGGQGLSTEAERLFARLAQRYRVPHPMPLAVGLGLVVPTLLAHGSEAQKENHIAPTLRAQEVWCQLFSEPEAGSDLASLRTSARPDGDQWLVTGQKVWTSFAGFATHGILLARTDPDAPKHGGITMFIVDMASPGIEVRPLREMTGGRHFNEVFLDEVRIPATDMVGAPGLGWTVAMTTLGNERDISTGSGGGQAGALIELSRRLGRSGDPLVRQALAEIWTGELLVRTLAGRAKAARALGRSPGPEGSLLKLLGARLGQRAAEIACDLAGAGSMAWSGDDERGEALSYELAYSRMLSIAGGTNEIQRNILGERVLGLAREPRGAAAPSS